MSDHSIRQLKERYSNLKDLDDTQEKSAVHRFIDPNPQGALDGCIENMCCEIFNRSGEEITLTNIHPFRHQHWFMMKPPGYWMKFTCKPEEWTFLPHGLYKIETKSGKPATVTINFGDQMFKGNKLPSRPEARRVRVAVPGK